MGFFSIFLYTITLNCVTTGARKMSIEYMFCFICSEQCIKIISSRKKWSLFSSIFKEINATPTFQKVGGVTLPLTFCRWHKNFSWNRINHHKIDFYSQGIFRFLFATIFNWNEPEHQLIAKLTLPHGKIIRVIFPLCWFTKKYFGFNTKSIKCAWQIYQRTSFLNYCRLIYFQNMCIVTYDF